MITLKDWKSIRVGDFLISNKGIKRKVIYTDAMGLIHLKKVQQAKSKSKDRVYKSEDRNQFAQVIKISTHKQKYIRELEKKTFLVLMCFDLKELIHAKFYEDKNKDGLRCAADMACRLKAYKGSTSCYLHKLIKENEDYQKANKLY